jgi:hypothetical protein
MSATPGTVKPMTHRRQLRGVELRYALTLYLFQHGQKTVAELIDALEYQGFDIPGRTSKVVSRLAPGDHPRQSPPTQTGPLRPR